LCTPTLIVQGDQKVSVHLNALPYKGLILCKSAICRVSGLEVYKIHAYVLLPKSFMKSEFSTMYKVTQKFFMHIRPLPPGDNPIAVNKYYYYYYYFNVGT
jgi:hypothetical protein